MFQQLGGKGAELLSDEGLMDHGDFLSLYDRHLLQPSLTESIEVAVYLDPGFPDLIGHFSENPENNDIPSFAAYDQGRSDF